MSSNKSRSRTPGLEVEVLTVTVDEALAMIGIGRTRFYELVADGTISTVKLGRRRLVHVDSLRLLVAPTILPAPYVPPSQLDLL